MKKVLFTLFTFIQCAVIPQLYAATESVTVNAAMRVSPISPYVLGTNSSAIYVTTPMYNSAMINQIKAAGIKMYRFPPGMAGNRYDFRYNNNRGRYQQSQNLPWVTAGVVSLEEEMRFCRNSINAEPLVLVNSAFRGPGGTGIDIGGTDVNGGAFLNYTVSDLGITTDTPQNRAKYAAAMVTYLNNLSDQNGWPHPKYYEVGNEYEFDGQTFESYRDCFREYYTAMKAVDPNIILLASLERRNDESIVAMEDVYDIHSYYAGSLGNAVGIYEYAPGCMDGSFALKNHSQNDVELVKNYFAAHLPGKEPLIAQSEWGDSVYSSTQSVARGTLWGTYRGATYTSHMIYRFIKNKMPYSCAWYLWSLSETEGHMFGADPAYYPRPRYYSFMLYSYFTGTLLECYDTSEYTSAGTDYRNFFDVYKDDRDDLLVQSSIRSDGKLALMFINLNSADPYDAAVRVNNFNMAGTGTAYVMNNTNTYRTESGPPCAGPSTSPVSGLGSGNGNTFTYTVQPWNVVCLVLDGAIVPDATPPGAPSAVRDGNGSADLSSSYNTKVLKANWDQTQDLESGVTTYWYAVGTTPGTTNVVAWTNNGNNRGVSAGGLSLTVGQSYYFTVKAENGYNVYGTPVNSNGVTITAEGTQAPVMGLTGVRDGTGASDTDVVYYQTTELSANWDAVSGTQSGVDIRRYWYAIGTSAGATDVVNWSSAPSAAVTAKNITLNMNGEYFFSVKAENDMGLISAPVNSDGVMYTRAAPVFQDTFETWTTPPGIWDSVLETAGSAATSNDTAKAGTRSLKCVNNTTTSKSYLTKSLAASPIMYVQYYIYLSSGFSNGLAARDLLYCMKVKSERGESVYFGPYEGSAGPTIGMLQTGVGTWPSVTTAGQGTILRECTWYRVEVCMPETSTTSVIRWWLDGVEQLSLEQDLAGLGKWNQVTLGLYSSPKAATVYFDNLTVAAGYIGTPPTDDTTPPTSIAWISDGETRNGTSEAYSLTALSANWGPSMDPESGVVKYWYCIGTSPSAQDVVGWTDNGMYRTITSTGLALELGRKYYFTVKSENWVGMQCTPITSAGQTVAGVRAPTGRATAYPNPFSFAGGKKMYFEFTGSQGGEVKIWTVSGRMVKKITVPAGTKVIDWDGKNEDGQKLARGIYIYTMDDSGTKKTGKIAAK